MLITRWAQVRACKSLTLKSQFLLLCGLKMSYNSHAVWWCTPSENSENNLCLQCIFSPVRAVGRQNKAWGSGFGYVWPLYAIKLYFLTDVTVTFFLCTLKSSTPGAAVVTFILYPSPVSLGPTRPSEVFSVKRASYPRLFHFIRSLLIVMVTSKMRLLLVMWMVVTSTGEGQ